MSGKKSKTIEKPVSFASRDLRRNAEARLRKKRNVIRRKDDPRVDALLHELQVHQVELEIQNEELQRAFVETGDERKKYRDLFELAPVAFFTVDADGKILEVNHAGAELLGKERNDLIKRRFQHCVAEDGLLEFNKFCRRARTRGTKQACEVQLIGNGEPLAFVRIEGMIAWEGSGTQERIRCAVIDISERKLMEEKNTFQAQLIDGINDAVIASDERFALTYWNKGAERSFGWKAEEVLGRRGEEVLRSEFKDPHRSEIIDKLVKNGFVSGEATQFHKNGEPIQIEFNTIALKDRKGRTTGYLSVNRDITARKRLTEALFEQEEQYRQLFESSPVGIGLADMKGNLLTYNDAMLQSGGYTREDLHNIGNVADLYYKPTQRSEALSMFQKQGFLKNYPVQFKRKDGTPYDAVLSLNSIEIGGKPCLQAVVQDVTESKHAEEALRESEERFRLFSEASSEGVVLHEAGRILDVNRRGAQMLGYEPTDVIGRSVLEFSSPESRAVILKNVQSGYEGLYEAFALRKDGSTFAIELTGRNVLHHGRPARVTLIRDITERKHSEDALRENERQYRLLFESNPHPMWVYDLETLSFLAVNDAAIMKYGYTRAEFLKMTIADIRPTTDIERLKDNIAHITEGLDEAGVWRHRLKDGTIIEVEITSHTLMYNGRRAELVLANDITKRKLAEEALRESEERFRSLFENVAIGLYRTAPDGRILLANPALLRMIGFKSFEELALRNLEETGFEPDYPRSQFRERMEREGQITGLESAWTRNDGSVVYVRESARAVRSTGGNILYYEGTVEDISERKRLEDQLLQSHKMQSIGTLAGGIAHDFNNLLGIIIGHASLMKDELDTSPKMAFSLDAIEKAASRGAALVRQLLTFARKTDVRLEPVQTNDIVRELTKMLDETLPRSIAVTTELAPNLPFIIADSTQIHQVLLNLCVNARDAMPDGGVLSISTSVRTGPSLRTTYPMAAALEYAQIDVADTGIGMDETSRKRIFEPFFTTKEFGKGTGLGLAVAFGIVESHNGFIDVESDAGKGTTFHLFLPAQAGGDKLHPMEVPKSSEVSGGTETILVVEDEELLREMLISTLESKGYSVLVARDGTEAFALYQKHRHSIHLVLTDMGLPGLSGKDLVMHLTEINPSAKVIIASGYLESEVRLETLLAGAKEFIQKPYEPADVLRIIRQVLDQA